MVVEIISGLAMVYGEWSGAHVRIWLHLQNFICSQCREIPWQASGSDWRGLEATHGTTLWDWKNMNYDHEIKKKDREWPVMGIGENKTDRERWWWVVLMMRVSTLFSEEVQPWAPPAGHIFAAVSLLWPATPQWRNIGAMCEPAACLPAEGVISASGWGAKVTSGQWEGKWASQSRRKSLHPDKWSTSPFIL